MPEEATYPKIKILFVNIIAILYKATALNVSRLHLDMREVKQLVHMSKQEIWMRQMFIFLISGLLLIRFLLCFVGLVTNIVAIYPILTNSQPELLMPSIFVQLFDNVILNIYEIVLGYAAVRFLQPEGLAVFAIFLTKMFIKTSCCISVL
ncbi:CG34307 [Drosophila busckii]|uniref:CG34307 n=2 Tax=Drosophila busckii TaxID=30019 RepID=A0A0M4EI90_DROBS|nr:CG34307 [Drosophila busckii]